MELYLAVGGFIIITVLGIMGRLFWSGFRETIVKAVLDSSLKEMLGGITSALDSIKDDTKDMRVQQRQGNEVTQQNRVELDGLRSRLDNHLQEAAEQWVVLSTFKQATEQFMDRFRAAAQVVADEDNFKG